jgi:hypothetical protein
LQIDPFEAGFESDECRCLQNERVGRIVTACPKYFWVPGDFQESSDDKKLRGWSSFRRICRQMCDAPSWDTAKVQSEISDS